MSLLRRSRSRVLAAAVGAVCAAWVVTGGAAAQRAGDDEQSGANRAFSPRLGEIAMAAREKLQAEPPDPRGAIADLDRALEIRGVSAYEKGVILRMRGQAKYDLDDARGALADWSRALEEGDLVESERLALMSAVGQLHLLEGDYREAVEQLEEWIRLGGEASDKVHLNLVRAYVELGEPRAALGHALQAYEKASPREKAHYDALNYLYAELDRPAERAALLSEMVELFPQDKDVWRSIAALHFEAGRAEKAFEINKIMYLNGMLATEAEIMAVVDYYSYYEAPYRGARILEREMNAGRVERRQENYEKLARLYRHANDFDRAIDPLEAAARMAPDGELYRALGEAYYAEARYEDAVLTLLRALEKGGLEEPGDAWLLIGTARYEARDLEDAIAAFERAAAYAPTQEDARTWAAFVRNEIDAARERRAFELAVMQDVARIGCERQLMERIIYVETWRPGDPDCIAIVERGDFSSVPEIVAKQQAIAEELGEAGEG